MLNEKNIRCLTDRYHREWKKRETVGNHAFGSFTPDEMEHITLLNDYLMDLTREAIEKMQRIDRDLRMLIGQGRDEYHSYHVDATIAVDLLEEQYDTEPAEFRQAIDACKPIPIIGLNEEHTEDERREHIGETLHLMNEQEGPIGRRWMELWTRHRVALCMAFAWLFDDQNVFAPCDIMRLQPDNFEVRMHVFC